MKKRLNLIIIILFLSARPAFAEISCRKITITKYNGVSVGVLVDEENLRGQRVNIVLAYHGTVVGNSKILAAAENMLERAKEVVPDSGNYVVCSVAYPEGEKIAGGNIKEAEAAVLWAKNDASRDLNISVNKVFLLGHSQGAYLVAILNTLQQTDGVVSNSPGPLDHQILCERVEQGMAGYGGGVRKFTCDVIKNRYGSVLTNPQPYQARSLLQSFASAYKAKILFIQGMQDDNSIQLELWPEFRRKVEECSDCAECEFLEIAGGRHGAGFKHPIGVAAIKKFLLDNS